MSRDDSQSREFYNALARRLSRPGGLELARDLQRAGLMKQPDPVPSPPANESEQGPRNISIWQPVARSGQMYFERPPVGMFGDHFADRRSFSREKAVGTTRICFFGESVAAGYLYAPHLTPAKVLDHQLNATGHDHFEVIDLARTNETLASLTATVEASMQLEPDAIVLFTGNNWALLEEPTLSPYTPSVDGRQRLAKAWVEDNGAEAAVRPGKQRVLKRAADYFSRIAKIARQANVPVVCIIPAVNLADWSSFQPPIWLPADGNARWFERYEACRAKLLAEDWEEAASIAFELLELDGENNPVSCRLLALAKAGAGKTNMAHEAFQAEVENASLPLMCFLDSPRLSSKGRELQRRIASAHGWATVDCQTLFSAQGERSPGREYFVDYCHLNREGMRLLMAETSSVLFRSLGRSLENESVWRDQASTPVLAANLEAVAQLGAALHGAHRLADPDVGAEITAYWLGQALATDPTIADTLIDLAAVRASRLPAALHQAQQHNLTGPHKLTPQHGWRYDYLDGPFLQIAESVLRSVNERKAAQFLEVLCREHEAACRRAGNTLSLLPFNLAQPLQQRFTDLLDHDDHHQSATYRAYWPVTEFTLITTGESSIILSLTARLPQCSSESQDNTVKIKVNGQSVQTFCLQQSWQTQSIEWDTSELKPGMHRFTIHWPKLPATGEQSLATAITRLGKGIEADIHPCFGEIHTFHQRLKVPQP